VALTAQKHVLRIKKLSNLPRQKNDNRENWRFKRQSGITNEIAPKECSLLVAKHPMAMHGTEVFKLATTHNWMARANGQHVHWVKGWARETLMVTTMLLFHDAGIP
jgi:hypothetical protein